MWSPTTAALTKETTFVSTAPISVALYLFFINISSELNRTIHSQILKSIRPQRLATAPLVMYPTIPLPMQLAPLLRNLYNRKQPIATCMVRLTIDLTKYFRTAKIKQTKLTHHYSHNKYKLMYMESIRKSWRIADWQTSNIPNGICRENKTFNYNNQRKNKQK